MRLLVTRPKPDAHAQAEELRDLGHEPIVQPLLQFKRLEADLAPLLACDALIVTSGNALRALTSLDIGAISKKTIYCAGHETAKRALSTGFQSIAAVAESARALAAGIVAEGFRGSLVHVTGEHQAFDLDAALTREGLSIHTLKVYSMAARQALEPPVVEGIKSGTIGGVILMSPRTTEVFVDLCRNQDLLADAQALRYFCLADSVAEKLGPIRPEDVSIAAKPNRTALMALIPAASARSRSHEKQDGSKL